MIPNTWSRILLMGDDPRKHATFKAGLDEVGHDVVDCLSLDDAMTCAQREPFAVALVDVQSPDARGVELLGLLMNKNLKVHVVINAEFQSLLSVNQTIHAGLFTYFEQTASSSSVLNLVHRAFRSYATHSVEELQTGMVTRTAALEEQQANFQHLVEHVQEVFWIAIPDHSKILYMSPRYESVWGRNCGSLVDHPHDVWDAVHPQDQEYVLTRVAEGEVKGFQAEFRIIRSDQTVRFIRAQTFPIRNTFGEVVRMAGVAEDMTEHKRVQETLVKTERQFRQSSRMEAIGTLAGGIAHDFNNILTAILGYTELGLASVPKGSRTQRNLQEVLTAGHRAKHLVLQILAFSRQSGQGKKPTPIHTVIQEALKLLRATIPTSIEIRQSLMTEASVLADSTQLHQVVINLCTNAEYAMRETGGLLAVILEDVDVTKEKVKSVSGLKVGPHIRLIIQDNGTGMSPDVLERMFDPFFTTKPIGEGSGMGLAVVHGIVTNHGGALMIDSMGGKGTKVEVYLPIIPTPDWDGSGDQDVIPLGKETILFVDDEETIVRLGKELLSTLGYTVEVHTNSQDALHAFRHDPQRFDLVITDQAMPGLTGEALSRELLRIRPELPIILCTGFSHIMTAEKAKALGIQAYLMKPLAIRDLAPIVRHVLDKTLSPLV